MPLFKKKRTPEAHIKEGQKYLGRGMYEKAAGEFRQGLEAFPRHNELHYLLGLACLKSGKEEEAEAEFRKTLLANPYHAEARRKLERISHEKPTSAPKTEKFRKDAKRDTPEFEGEDWEEVKEKYADLFSEIKKEEGEQGFKIHMIMREFAFKYERRNKDAPAFFFLAERYRQELSGPVFDLMLNYASSLNSQKAKDKRERLLEQARWIAQNLGEESHIARVEKIFWK